jgi:uncharacterized protein (TIGR02145 family)
MAENLNYAGNNDEIGSCYGKKPKNCEIYGALYNWYEAKKICPPGWHLPNNEELETLVELAGGEEIAGKKLKAKNGQQESECKYTTEETTGRGKVIVTEHDDCATDEFGFSALLGGGTFFSNNENFRKLGDNGYWWSATEKDKNVAYYLEMYKGAVIVFIGTEDKYYNLRSVRCLKNP